MSLENPVELLGVVPPENPVELPRVSPPENEVDHDVVTPPLKSDYDSENESDDKYEDKYTPAQKRQSFIHPEAIPTTSRNVQNIRPWKKNNYVKEKINQSMSFEQVGNDLNKDALLYLQHKVM